MQFTRIDPPDALKNYVECYWIVESADREPHLQKIIPDGFPEIIFHFGDPYRINLSGKWELQHDSLLAGQITKYFYLENTGRSDILGIKMKPAALAHLLGMNMHMLKDKVLTLHECNHAALNMLSESIRTSSDHRKQINMINEQLMALQHEVQPDPVIELAVDTIFSSRGMNTVSSLCQQCEVSERQLERLFRRYIGLTPKFYARIIRFSYIFQVTEEGKSWSDVGLESGFYDQPHFIRNFKAFTGEDPSGYFFNNPTLANFFMKKK